MLNALEHLSGVDRCASSFVKFISDLGYVPPKSIVPDTIHRIPALGKKPSNLSASVKLFADGRGGWLFDFVSGQRHVWQCNHHFVPLSAADQVALQVELAKCAAEREAAVLARQFDAALLASQIWRASPLAEVSHPYLVKKKVCEHRTRLSASGDLIIPVFDAHFKLCSLQFISPDGSKRFLPGGKVKGCFWWLGKFSGTTNTVLMAEGFATAASLFERTNCLTVMALSANNFLPVAKSIRARLPNAEIIICGDNDLSGTGQKMASLAALGVGGLYKCPPVQGSDWNDFFSQEGGAL